MSELYRGTEALWGTMLIFLFCYALIQLLRMQVRMLYTVLCAAAGITAFLTVQYLSSEHSTPPLTVPSIVLLILTVLAAAVVRRIRILRRSRITLVSIKECFDTLPAGLCVYYPVGLPKIVNPSMDRICRAASGDALSDASAFWQQLHDGTLPCSISGGEKPIIRLPDGSAYSFTRYESAYDGTTIFELIASDITEEYRLTEELKEKQARVTEINSRLKALHSELKYVIMEKEVLQIKVRIHDNLGQALLLARQYLREPESVDRNALFDMWQDNNRLLEHEDREAWQTPYFVNSQRARLLGIRLETEGTLPTEEHLIPVIDTAIAVHTTNVRRHAEGDCARIRTEDTGSAYVLHFTNNGKPPVPGSRPAGGLGNVGRAAEEIGGQMEIRTVPAFEMILTLPKQKTVNCDTLPHRTMIRSESEQEERNKTHGI